MDTRRMTKWVKTLEPQASDEMLILAKGVTMCVKGRGILGLGLPTMMMMICADGMEYDGMEYGENSLFVSKQAAHPPFFAPPLVIRPPHQGVGVGEDEQGRL